MEMKMPYYMMYPLPDLFGEDKIEKRDYEYLKSMYPDVAKRILPYVEAECERYEYEESMIYDEYPDKLQLCLMAKRISDKVQREEKIGELDKELIRNLVEVLLYQELLKRRYNRRRRQGRVIW